MFGYTYVQENQMTKPDFEEWARNITWSPEPDYQTIQKRTEIALKQAWEQGYRYAVANNWWQEQEKQAYKEGIEDTLKGYDKI